MFLSVVILTFRYPGCRSLKEKRHRTGGFRERLGRQTGIAIGEVRDQSSLKQGEWHVAVLANSRALLDQRLATVEAEALRVDGVIVGQKIERID
jgi:uncharacterized protein YlxP (DUF503 family)